MTLGLRRNCPPDKGRASLSRQARSCWLVSSPFIGEFLYVWGDDPDSMHGLAAAPICH
jgi:hypothetical protein